MIKKLLKEQLFFILLVYVLSIFLLEIIPIINRIAMGILIIISLLDYYTLRKVEINKQSLFLQFFFILPFIYSLVLLCNGNFTLLNVAFPIFLLILNADIFKGERILNQVYKALNISAVIVFVICLVGVVYRFYNNYFLSNSLIEAFSEISKIYWWNNFVHKSLVSPLDIHPSYLCLFTLLAINKNINNLLNDIKIDKIDKENLIYLLVIILFTILIASKMAYMVLACLISIFLIRLARKRFYKQIVLVLFIIIPFLSSLYYFLPSIRDRITVDYRNFEQSSFDLDNHSPASERIFIWKTSAKIMVENPLGLYCINSKEIIWNRLDKSDKTELIEKNAHNNFLEFGLIYGYLGIILLIAFLIYSVQKAINNKDCVFLGVIFVFILFSLVESTLVREMGVLYMAFIFQLHLINTRKQN